MSVPSKAGAASSSRATRTSCAFTPSSSARCLARFDLNFVEVLSMSLIMVCKVMPISMRQFAILNRADTTRGCCRRQRLPVVRTVMLLIALINTVHAAPPSPTDSELIQGRWEVVKDWEGGVLDTSSYSYCGEVMVFRQNKLVFEKPGEICEEMTFTLDAGKSPKQVDWGGTSKDGYTLIVKGVYSLNGDSLRIAAAAGNRQDAPTRPTAVESTKQSKWYFFELVRRKNPIQKDANETKKTKSAADPEQK